jgi:hypothetical protein
MDSALLRNPLKLRLLLAMTFHNSTWKKMAFSLADMEINDTSPCSQDSLEILLEGFTINFDASPFYTTVMKEHMPLNTAFIISDNVHFCFNQLGSLSCEKTASRCQYVEQFPLSEAGEQLMKSIFEEVLKKLTKRELKLLKQGA